MGSKKHKKHHRSEKKESKESSRPDKPGPGLKLVLKVGGGGNIQKPASPPKPAAEQHHGHHHHHHSSPSVQRVSESVAMPPPAGAPSAAAGGSGSAPSTPQQSQVKEELDKGPEAGHTSTTTGHEKHKKSKKKKKKKSSDRERKRHKHHHHHHHHHHREHNHERKEKRRREHEHLSGMGGEGFPPPAKRPLVESELLSREEPRLCNIKKKSSRTPLQTLLSYLLRGLQKKDPQNFFAWPVSDMIAPGYSSIIAHPMDFSRMKQKIDNKEYTSVHQFKSDLKLMCDNAMTYNRADTVYFKAAKKMWHSGQKIFTREQLLSLSRNIPSILEMTPEELGFDIGDDPSDLRSYQTDEADGHLSALSRSPDVFARRSKHKAGFHTSVSDSDDMEADEILMAARKAARAASDRLTLQKPNCRFGFLRQRGDGSTSLAILNPSAGADLGPEDIPVNLETLVGKLSHGGGSIAGFKEDPKNLVRPVKSLNYGSFSSYAPQYDSMFSNLNKDESDLVLSTYGDDLGIQYAESLVTFAKDCDYLMSMVDSMLDTLTSGTHSRTVKQIHERRAKEEKAKVDASSKDSSMDLSELDIDMEFLNEGDGSESKGDVGEEDQMDKNCMIQRKLDETSTLLQDLAHVQRQRLSAPPPSHLANIQGPTNAEIHLAEKVTRSLTDLAMQTTPSGVCSLKGVRKAMGITYETVHCPTSLSQQPQQVAMTTPVGAPAAGNLLEDHNLMGRVGQHKSQVTAVEEGPMMLDSLSCGDSHKAVVQPDHHINNCDLTVFLDNPSAVLNL